LGDGHGLPSLSRGNDTPQPWLHVKPLREIGGLRSTAAARFPRHIVGEGHPKVTLSSWPVVYSSPAMRSCGAWRASGVAHHSRQRSRPATSRLRQMRTGSVRGQIGSGGHRPLGDIWGTGPFPSGRARRCGLDGLCQVRNPCSELGPLIAGQLRKRPAPAGRRSRHQTGRRRRPVRPPPRRPQEVGPCVPFRLLRGSDATPASTLPT
jgi:hypothetical protein